MDTQHLQEGDWMQFEEQYPLAARFLHERDLSREYAIVKMAERLGDNSKRGIWLRKRLTELRQWNALRRTLHESVGGYLEAD